MCVCGWSVCVCAHLSSSFFSTFAFALANSFAFISIVAKCNQITLMFPLMSFTLTLRARTATTTIADNNDNNEATHSHCATLPHSCPLLLRASAAWLLSSSLLATVSQLFNQVSVRLISSSQLSLFSACFHFLPPLPACPLAPPLRQLLCLSLSVQEIRTQCPARHFYWTDNSAASPRNHEMQS